MKKKQNIKRKLDNTAKIFSLANHKSANIFRFSAILTESINVAKLSKALNKTLEELPSFKVQFAAGIFWNSFKCNPKEPIIKEDSKIPCEYINLKENNNYLFKLTYYQNKINLDMFHVLTDGTGAITFLKILLYNYLDLMHKLPKKRNKTALGCDDLTLKYYDKTYKQNYKVTSSYQIPGKVSHSINNTNFYTLNINDIKKVCKKTNSTITEYLTALYIYSLYLSIYNKKSNQDIIITIPISLRNIYKEDTLSNFFTYTNINANIINKKT